MSDNKNDQNKDNKNNSEKKSHFEESGYGSVQPSERAEGSANNISANPDSLESDPPVQLFTDDDKKSKLDIIEENTLIRRKQRKYVIAFWGTILIGFLGMAMMFIGISLGWFGFMPSFEELENPQTFLASEIFSHDNELLGTYYVENRSKSHYAEISPNLINALIATEDVRFRQHSGK